MPSQHVKRRAHRTSRPSPTYARRLGCCLLAGTLGLLAGCRDDASEQHTPECNFGAVELCGCDGLAGTRICGADGRFAECRCVANETSCDDQIDEDLDGDVDCADDDCALNASCYVERREICDDQGDNDQDGAVDCADPDCVDAPVCTITEVRCDDQLDDDGDGDVDCRDSDCSDDPACQTSEVCGNGNDDDGDGDIDCDDEDCQQACSTAEVCDNLVDDDGDGDIDCDDDECAGVGACPGCGNGVAENGEACDGSDVRGLTCDDLGFPFGDVECADDCSAVIDRCRSHECGNGIIEAFEECDGNTVPDDVSCQTMGFDDGVLGCSDNCFVFDTATCELVGSRADGTCDNPIDLNEVPVTGDPPAREWTDTVESAGDNHEGSCGLRGREVVFQYTAPSSGILNVYVYGETLDDDYTFYVRTGSCTSPDGEIECRSEGEFFNVTAGRTYYLFVQGRNIDHTGEFDLIVLEPT